MPESVPASSAHQPATYDLVIHRAHVFDGYQAHTGLRDVGVNGGQIADVSAEHCGARQRWTRPKAGSCRV